MTAQRVRQFLGFSVVIVVAVVLIAWSGQWAGRREAASQADAVKRVCRAWHESSRVKVLAPGIRRAEG